MVEFKKCKIVIKRGIMSKIYLVDIEHIPTRYTSQWKTWIPEYISNAGLELEIISGTDNMEYTTTPGGFFNFFETNLYKMQQGQKLAKLFIKNKVSNGDIFLFTDGWHPAVFSLRQMINLSKIDAKIFGMFHAGSYDPADILGVTCRDAFKYMETGLLDSLDKAFFATEFSRTLMIENIPVSNEADRESIAKKMFVTGFPYKFDHLKQSENKKNYILFPHRISPEKHIELFDISNGKAGSLEFQLPDFEYIVTLNRCGDKDSFHELLAESKYTVSFADQETWGISVFESLVSGCIPIVPDKLSYSEMYSEELKYDPYDSNGSEDREKWPKKVAEQIMLLESLTESEKQAIIEKNKVRLLSKYCTFDNILSHLKNVK